MRHLAVFIATGFWSGLIPPLRPENTILRALTFFCRAGTYGSFFAGIPVVFLTAYSAAGSGYDVTFYSLVCLIVYVMGHACVPSTEQWLGPRRDWRQKVKIRDQNEITIDEVLGMLVTCLPFAVVQTTPDLVGMSVAFIAFRLLDSKKVWPATFFDALKNSDGVMLDDVVAGLQAAIVVTVYLYLVGQL